MRERQGDGHARRVDKGDQDGSRRRVTMPPAIKHQGLSLCDYHYDLAGAIKRAAVSKEKI